VPRWLLTWLDDTLVAYVDDDVVAYIDNDVAAYMDDDVAAYMDNDMAIDVAMMTTSQHTQFKDRSKLGQLFY
jgi:hypothetical protein